MINQPRIPDTETIARHVAKMQELCRHMDRHIAELDEFNARLELDSQNSLLGAFHKKRAERLAAQGAGSPNQTC